MSSGKVREAVGVFNEAAKLRTALSELRQAGFAREELGLLASEHSVKQSLHDLYTCTESSWKPGGDPVCAFVAREGTGDTGTAHGGGLYFIGTAGGAGAAVAFRVKVIMSWTRKTRVSEQRCADKIWNGFRSN